MVTAAESLEALIDAQEAWDQYVQDREAMEETDED